MICLGKSTLNDVLSEDKVNAAFTFLFPDFSTIPGK